MGRGPGGGGDDDAAGIQRSVAQRNVGLAGRPHHARAVAVAVQSTVVWLGFMTQGLLAGFGVLHVFMTYYMDDAQTDGFSTITPPSRFPRSDAS